MRILIYLSGITGSMLILIRILGIFFDFSWNDIILISGIILLGAICIPLTIIRIIRENRKINRIIESYKGKEKEKKKSHLEKGETPAKGWGMNDSPYRDRKSGLRWEGGNIKGVTAKRGSRRSFLK